MSLKELANDTLAVVKRGGYEVDEQRIDFAVSQCNAVQRTQLYSPNELDELRLMIAHGKPPTVRVIDGTTQQIAQQMAGEDSIALLNFASARNPGGGFLNGAKAQEEDICRYSGLYPCLIECMDYYETNRRQESLLYTDCAIFSPDVPFFKVRGTGEFLAEPFLASVITAPAPNSGPFLRSNPGSAGHWRSKYRRASGAFIADGRTVPINNHCLHQSPRD